MKPNCLSTKKHTLRFAVILSALILAGCASTQSTTSSTSASSAFSTVSKASTSEESGADETDSTGGAMNGTIGSVIEANLSFKNKDFYMFLHFYPNFLPQYLFEDFFPAIFLHNLPDSLLFCPPVNFPLFFEYHKLPF